MTDEDYKRTLKSNLFPTNNVEQSLNAMCGRQLLVYIYILIFRVYNIMSCIYEGCDYVNCELLIFFFWQFSETRHTRQILCKMCDIRTAVCL